MPPAPLPVTVLIPAFNREELIRRAVGSVQLQEPAAAAQLLVVDDGSSDRTAEVARSLGVDVVRHDRNRGLSAARNTGLREARFDWVALLDSDDEWLPGHLATMWEERDSHAFVATAAIGLSATRRRWQGSCARGPEVLRGPARLLFPENFVSASSMMLRRDLALAVGGYDEDLRKVEDLDLLVRLLERGTGLAIPVAGCVYHHHDDQMSGDQTGMRSVHRGVIAKYADRPWWDARLGRSYEALSAWDEARAAERSGDRVGALRGLADIATSPARLVALGRVLAWRARGRRMLSRSPSQTRVHG